MSERYDLHTKKRSSLRQLLGKSYYSFLRYLLWISRKYKFTKHFEKENLPCLDFSHKTILLRKLRDVDMIYQQNKIQNLKIAVKKLDGIVITPGETFSYWKLIGKPTYRKGYLDGIILRNGTVTHGCGGGLCQLSNLIFWIALHSPLEIIERHRHGYDVFPDSNRTQPFGSGATCYYPHGDLMIYNPTNEKFQLRLNVGEEYLVGSLLSEYPPLYRYEIIEKNHEMKSEWWGGFSRHNELHKRMINIDDDSVVDEFLVVENHAMMTYSPFLSDNLTAYEK